MIKHAIFSSVPAKEKLYRFKKINFFGSGKRKKNYENLSKKNSDISISSNQKYFNEIHN